MLDSRTYNLKKGDHTKEGLQQNLHQNLLQRQDSQGLCDGYDSSDDESCDLENGDFDTMSSCRSRSRSCCSVTTVANDDFEYFQRKGTKVISWLNLLSFYKFSTMFLAVLKLIKYDIIIYSARLVCFCIILVSARKIIIDRNNQFVIRSNVKCERIQSESKALSRREKIHRWDWEKCSSLT